MKALPLQNLAQLAHLLQTPALEPIEHESRLKSVERDVVLPVKFIFIGVLIIYFFHSPWFTETDMPRSVVHEVVQTFVAIYTAFNLLGAFLLLQPRRWTLRLRQGAVMAMSFVDGLFVSSLTLVTGGFDSIIYWLLPGLVVRNAVSIPLARPQLALNLSVALSYFLAALLDAFITKEDLRSLDEPMRRALEVGLPENFTETFLLRLFILLLLAACCYGLQVLLENQRRVAEEGRESDARQEQLRAAGRLAAEIAHKIKNPLGIINNAAFSIQRALEQGQKPPLSQAQIIREEVDRADRIITELMGYAQLAEGHVEKLNVVQELNRAILAVFPPGARFSVQIHTDFDEHLPPLLMQRQHFSEMVGNILLNAREALAGLGQLDLRAWTKDETVFISIKDDGPGIPPEKLEQVFEAYFSTKDKGTGLGLAIVRHNAEMYNGRARVESKPGQGAEFILELPTRTFMKKRA
jgi:signal transduction histidine kinase